MAFWDRIGRFLENVGRRMTGDQPISQPGPPAPSYSEMQPQQSALDGPSDDPNWDPDGPDENYPPQVDPVFESYRNRGPYGYDPYGTEPLTRDQYNNNVRQYYVDTTNQQGEALYPDTWDRYGPAVQNYLEVGWFDPNVDPDTRMQARASYLNWMDWGDVEDNEFDWDTWKEWYGLEYTS